MLINQQKGGLDMLKRIMFLMILFLNVSGALHALNSIDTFFLNHSVMDCNGETPNCGNSYERAVELNDDRSPVSPEIRF